MGFKCRFFNVQAGSEEFPVGDTNALRRQRAEVLIKKAAQCLLECECGWSLDTRRCQTFDDFINIPSSSTSAGYAPGLMFVNSESGCKMLMFYEPNNISTKNYNNTSSFTYSPGTFHSGLCCSIIPGGSQSEFGDPSTNSFYPDDATRVIGTYYRMSSPSRYSPAAMNPLNGMYFAYYILATEDCISVSMNHWDGAPLDGSVYVPIYATGRLFGHLANKEDDLPQSKYGTLVFRVPTSSYEQNSGVIGFSQSSLCRSGTSYNVFGKLKVIGDGNIICFTNSKGEWLNTPSSTNAQIFMPLLWLTLGPNAFSESGCSAWSAFAAIRADVNLETGGVISGNGFKGLLETEYFRAVGNGIRGETFNNGKFYYCEDNIGLAIGWDPSNTITLRG